MNRTRTIITGLIALVVLVFLLWEGFKWTAMRVYVGHDEALLITNKFGKQLPPERITAEDDSFKGVRQEVLGPGRYFINPVEYDTKVIKQVSIPAGDPSKWD